MSIPNSLSIFRILLVPGFIAAILYYRPEEDWLRFLALGIFILAIITDGIDGFIARKRGERTELGSMLDPLADKILLITGFICLSGIGNFPEKYSFPPYVPIVIISIDGIIVLGWALLYIVHGFVKPKPSSLGKASTFFQMMAIVSVLIHFNYSSFVWNAAVVFSVASGVGYIVEGSKLLNK